MPSEQEILKLIRKLTPNSKSFLFDDAAIIEKNLVVTTDTLVENTHFTLKTYKPKEIGYKAIAVNLSDIAAMGAKPLYALISLSLPTSIKLPWIQDLYKGFINCSKKYKIQIIGGNLTRSKEINISITLIGKALSKNIAKRSNAKPGDIVFVTGVFGDSACGLLLLNNHKLKNTHISSTISSPLIKNHKLPNPQIKLGQKIVQCSKRVALMDASDGLADCLLQISRESNVKIIIDEDKIPISSNTKLAGQYLNKDPLDLALYGGEDYQLVGTMNLDDIRRIKTLKIVGTVFQGQGSFIHKRNGAVIKINPNKAFKHFNSN